MIERKKREIIYPLIQTPHQILLDHLLTQDQNQEILIQTKIEEKRITLTKDAMMAKK